MMRGFDQGQLTLLSAVAFFGLGGPLISVGAPKLISIWFNERERKLAMGIYITGIALGSTTVLSITNSVIMPWMDGWRLAENTMDLQFNSFSFGIDLVAYQYSPRKPINGSEFK